MVEDAEKEFKNATKNATKQQEAKKGLSRKKEQKKRRQTKGGKSTERAKGGTSGTHGAAGVKKCQPAHSNASQNNENICPPADAFEGTSNRMTKKKAAKAAKAPRGGRKARQGSKDEKPVFRQSEEGVTFTISLNTGPTRTNRSKDIRYA
jgi:hypothetical protein